MKSKYLPLMATVLLGFGCAPPAEEPTAETPAVDLEAERDALMAADKAWSESVSDADEFLSYFADGAHFMPFGAPLAQGDAIRTAWEQLVSGVSALERNRHRTALPKLLVPLGADQSR